MFDMSIKKIATTALFLLLWAGTVFAQGGKIVGTISDAESGETLIGANVVIQGTTIGAATDFDGNYLILNVQPGVYTLEAKYIGYSTVVVSEVIVRSGLTTTQDFTMALESFEGEEIVVTAVQPTVLKDVTSSEARVSAAQIAKLPVQELNDVVRLQAGVNVASDGGIHIRGGRATEVSYIVDGVRVTDDFNRSQGLRVENQSVEELQIISGTFNAEYGQAMSGVVNITSKAGSNEFHGNVSVMSGGYYVYDADLWRDVPNRVSDIDPMMQRQLQVSLSGPIIKDKITFFASGRYFQDEGFKKGRNAFSPQGAWSADVPLGQDIAAFRDPWNRSFDASQPWNSIDTLSVGGNQVILLSDDGTRDSSIVNMETAETYNLQGNVQFNVTKKLKFNLIGSYGQESFFGYNHQLRLAANGASDFQRKNYLVNFKTTYTPSATTFLTANIATTFQEESRSLYDNPYDPRYFELGVPPPPGANQFNVAGTDNSIFSRSTQSIRGKIELSSQVNQRHFIKVGVEGQLDAITFENINLQQVTDDSQLANSGVPQELWPFIQTFVPERNTPGHQFFERNPITLAAFAQDKMEFEKFIVNIGLRFDYFNANDRVAADPRDPDITRPTSRLNRYNDINNDGIISEEEAIDSNFRPRSELEQFWWRDVDARLQLSPRFGIAYPISETGVINFSYGYFFQMPTYDQLYGNSQIFLPESSGLFTGYGNPDLDPERTIQYEIGVKQEIFEGTALEATIFYRDSRDYVANLGIQDTYNPTIFYQKNVNLDFQKSRGMTVALNQQFGGKFNFGIDYTYTQVEGSTTSQSALAANATGLGQITGQRQQDVYNFLIFQGWDRPHILNTQLFYNESTWGANLTGQFQSGQPYTPGIPFAVRTGLGASQQPLTNLARLPNSYVVNLNFYKNFKFKDNTVGMSVNIFNLLDTQVVTGVFADSGEPDRPFFLPGGTVDPTFLNDPNRYGQPRRIQVSLNYSF